MFAVFFECQAFLNDFGILKVPSQAGQTTHQDEFFFCQTLGRLDQKFVDTVRFLLAAAAYEIKQTDTMLPNLSVHEAIDDGRHAYRYYKQHR